MVEHESPVDEPIIFHQVFSPEDEMPELQTREPVPVVESEPLPPKLQQTIHFLSDAWNAVSPMMISRSNEPPELLVSLGQSKHRFALRTISADEFDDQVREPLIVQDVGSARLVEAGVPAEKLVPRNNVTSRDIAGVRTLYIIKDDFPFLFDDPNAKLPADCPHLPYFESLEGRMLGGILLLEIYSSLPSEKQVIEKYGSKESAASFNQAFETDIRNRFRTIDQDTEGAYTASIQQVRLQLLRDWSSRRDYRSMYYSGGEITQSVQENGHQLGFASIPSELNWSIALLLGADVFQKYMALFDTKRFGSAKKALTYATIFNDFQKEAAHRPFLERFEEWLKLVEKQAQAGHEYLNAIGFDKRKLQSNTRAYLESEFATKHGEFPKLSEARRVRLLQEKLRPLSSGKWQISLAEQRTE